MCLIRRRDLTWKWHPMREEDAELCTAATQEQIIRESNTSVCPSLFPTIVYLQLAEREVKH